MFVALVILALGIGIVAVVLPSVGADPIAASAIASQSVVDVHGIAIWVALGLMLLALTMAIKSRRNG
jgi:hypothetical protein